MCKLNNTLLNFDQWIIKEILKFLYSNENKNTTSLNLWDTANEVLKV
jgi:hypothetical protein